MPINSLTFKTQLSNELEKTIVQKSATGFLADNVLRAKFVGAKTVLIPEMNISGLGDYDRDNGFVTGAISVSNHSFALTQDRGRSFQLDREDNDETGIAGLAGQVMGEFVRTKVVPEVDAYCLSKIGGYAAGQSQTVTGTLATGAYGIFNDAVNKVQEEIGYDEELVAFVDGAFKAALEKSSEVTRMITVSEFKQGDVSMKVKSINGITLIPVQASRMKTAYTFYDGSTSGQTDGGFTPTDSASSIGLIVMPKRAASLVKKSEKIRVFDPDKNLDKDAYKFDYRLYYDVFLKNTMKDAIYVYLHEAPAAAGSGTDGTDDGTGTGEESGT